MAPQCSFLDFYVRKNAAHKLANDLLPRDTILLPSALVLLVWCAIPPDLVKIFRNETGFDPQPCTSHPHAEISPDLRGLKEGKKKPLKEVPFLCLPDRKEHT